MECNQFRDKQEIIKLRISKIVTTELEEGNYFQKEFIIKPLNIP